MLDKSKLKCNQPHRTPNDPKRSHVVKACYSGKEKIIHFGQQGAVTAGKPKEGESERMKTKRASFKARHAKNIAKGPSSAAYWANKVKWAKGGEVNVKNKFAEMRASPQNPVLGALAKGVKGLRDLAGRYQLHSSIPLVGGVGIDEMLGLPGATKELENWSYGNLPFRINPYAGQTASRLFEMKPGRQSNVADLALLGGDVLGLGSLAKPVAKAGARQVAQNINEAMMGQPNLMSNVLSSGIQPLNVVKPDDNINVLSISKSNYTPEQIANWATEKRQREKAQAIEREKIRQEEKQIFESYANSVPQSAFGNEFTKDEIENIQSYYRYGDKRGALAEGKQAAINAIERKLNEAGINIEKVSTSNDGKSKSLYVKVGDNLVRVSDHELPMTPKRKSDIESNRQGKWSKEVIVNDWKSTPIDDYINDILGQPIKEIDPEQLGSKNILAGSGVAGAIPSISQYNPDEINAIAEEFNRQYQ